MDVRISVASVDTGNSDRDEHLRSEDFFEADAHPYMTFRSTSVRDLGNGSLVVGGNVDVEILLEANQR